MWVGTATDIHDFKEAEQNLQESERKFRMLVENTPFPIAVYTNKEICIELSNKNILDFLGKGNNAIGELHSALVPELTV